MVILRIGKQNIKKGLPCNAPVFAKNHDGQSPGSLIFPAVAAATAPAIPPAIATDH